MEYIALDGSIHTSIKQTMDYDISYVHKHCLILHNSRYELYKFEDIEHLIPFLYGRYKISKFKFPVYISNDKREHQLTLLKTEDDVESFKQFIKT